jgi:hypothetical protein
LAAAFAALVGALAGGPVREIFATDELLVIAKEAKLTGAIARFHGAR